MVPGSPLATAGKKAESDRDIGRKARAAARLLVEGNTLRCIIDDPARAHDTRYAVYLQRDGERIAVRGYTGEPQAAFPGPHRAGSYAVTAFCHDVGTDARRKAHSTPLTITPPPASSRKSSDIPPPELVESIEMLPGRLRPDTIQRLDVRVGQFTYGLLTGKRRPGPLFVLLRGAEAERGKHVKLPRFSRFSWRDDFPGTVVCIADPTLQLDDDLKLGWYFGAPGHDAVEHVARIVSVLCEKLGLPVSSATFYGSSGGGYAALQCAARLGQGATAIAVNPQTDVLRYNVLRSVDAFLKVCTGGMSKEGAMEHFGPRLSAMQAWQTQPARESRCLIVQNLVDREHYDHHFGPFAKLFGLPDNARTADGRMASIVYEHPSGHAAEPREMLPQILETARGLQWHAGAGKFDQPPPAMGTAAPARPAPPAGAPARRDPADRGARRVPVAPLQPVPAMPGHVISAAQLYLPASATRSGSRPGAISYRPRADVKAVEIELPLDWTLDPFKDRNWNAQLHMWRLGDYLLLDAEKSRNFKPLRQFTAIMLDWHRYHVVEARKSIYAWQDMMVGIRAMKLAYVLSHWQHGHVRLSASEVAVLHELVETHLGFLLDPAEVRYSNHTLSDLHGALALARVVDAAARARIVAFVAQVFPEVLAAQFDAEGIHRENSIGYHRYGINYLRRLMATGWFDDFGLREVLQKAEQALEWFLLPDGRLAPIGDTDGAAPPENPQPTAFHGSDQAFSRSGYVVLRDDGNGDARKAAYLFFMGAYNSKFHKQSDDLSFLWYFGEDILCDTGKYAYKTDDCAKYALSRRAHNTVEIDQPKGPQLPNSPYGSAVRAVTTFDGGRLIHARVQFEDPRVSHERYCLHSLDGWVVVIDRLEGGANHDYTQWWHLAPRIVETARLANGLDAALPSGRRLAVRHATQRKSTVDLLRGVEKPRRQGWISQAYRQLEPSLALGIRQRGRDASFATLFAVDAPATSIQLDADQVRFEVTCSGGRPARYVVEFGAAGCAVRRQG